MKDFTKTTKFKRGNIEIEVDDYRMKYCLTIEGDAENKAMFLTADDVDDLFLLFKTWDDKKQCWLFWRRNQMCNAEIFKQCNCIIIK